MTILEHGQVTVDTIVKPKPREWLIEHLSTIGASRSAAAVGKGRFGMTRAKLFDQMTAARDGTLPESIVDKVDVRRGLIMEPVARELMAEHYRMPIIQHDQNCFLYDTDRPWGHALPDGWIADNPVELKVPRPGTVAKCNLSGLIAEWMIQGQHMLAFTGREKIYFGLLDPISVLIHPFEVYRDDAFIKTLDDGEADFFEHVESRTRPEDEGFEDFEIDDPSEAVIVTGDDIAKVGRAYNQLKRLEKEIATSLEATRERLKKLGPGGPKFEVPGVIRVNEVHVSGRASLDKDKVIAKYPHISGDKAFWKYSQPYTQFRTKDLEG